MANGVELATAYVSLTVDGSQINQGVRRGLGSVPAQADRVGSESGRRMGDRMSKGIVSSVGKIAGPLAAIFATVGIGKFISGTVDEAREAQKVSAITDAIVKSTGGVAKVSAKHIGDLSTAISNKIGVDDEAIQSSANLLLTFKNVRNEVGKSNNVFDQAVGLAQDLSKAGFGDAAGAAKMLGKALNDPVKGITALGRAGVTFSDSEKKRIKDAVKNNDLLKAQRIILGEVASQVGGVAAAQATTGEKVTVAWNNFKEQIGTKLLPVLDKLGAWFLDKGLPAVERFATGLSGVASILFGGDFKGAAKTFGFAEDSSQVDALFKIRDAVIVAFDKVKAFGSYIKDELWPALVDGYNTIQPGLEKAKKIIADTFGGANAQSLKDFGAILVDQVIPFIARLANEWLPIAATQFSLVVKAVEGLWAALKTILGIQAQVFSALLTGFIGVTTAAANMLDALSNVPGFGWAKDAADKLRGTVGQANALRDAVNGIPRFKAVTIDVSVIGSAFGPGGSVFDSQVPKLPRREFGGPVRAGQPVVVGEKRPELFWPDSNGTILPSVPAASGGPAGMGGFDYRRNAEAVADAMRETPLSVGVRETDRAIATHRANRALL